MCECNTVYSGGHGGPLDSVIRAYLCGERESSLQEFSGAVSPLSQTLLNVHTRSLGEGHRLIKHACNSLNEEFIRIQASIGHVRHLYPELVSNLDELIILKCRLCNDKYPSEADCITHLVETHFAKQCKYCLKLFTNKYTWKMCEKSI